MHYLKVPTAEVMQIFYDATYILFISLIRKLSLPDGLSNDQFRLNGDTLIFLAQNANLKWKHILITSFIMLLQPVLITMNILLLPAAMP